MQGGAKLGVQLFVWKIIHLINKNTRIDSLYRVLTTVSLVVPYPIF